MTLETLQPYRDRKTIYAEDAPLSIEEIVRAQCMDCEGVRIDDIAKDLGRSIAEIAKVLNTDHDKWHSRPSVATVGFERFKKRRR